MQYYPQYQQQSQPQQPDVMNQYNSMMGQLNNQVQNIQNQMSGLQQQFASQYPQYFQQQQQPINQQQTQPQSQQSDVASCIPVTSFDEAKVQTPVIGYKKMFTNFKNGELYIVYLDGDANKTIDTYIRSTTPQSSEQHQEVFASQNDIKYLFDYIKRLEGRFNAIGGNDNESTEQSITDGEQPTGSKKNSIIPRGTEEIGKNV